MASLPKPLHQFAKGRIIAILHVEQLLADLSVITIEFLKSDSCSLESSGSVNKSMARVFRL